MKKGERNREKVTKLTKSGKKSRKPKKSKKTRHKMETRARKRQKLSHRKKNESSQAETVPEKPEFMDLNDDVIFAMFQCLPLNDLCTMSYTCKRIQQLAGNYLQRKYPDNRLKIEIYNKWIGIDVSSQTPGMAFLSRPNEEYVRAFRSFIRNVEILMYRIDNQPMEAFLYLKANCCENLRELALFRIVDVQNRYGEIIKKQLENLESIKFDKCDIPDIYEGYLKYSPSLKQIAIKELPDQNQVTMEWTKHRYPLLKRFIYMSSNMIMANLEVFFQLNPQITTIGCSSIDIFRFLYRKKWQLDLLCLSFGCESKFQAISQELKTLCQEGHVKRFELGFRGNLNQYFDTRQLIELGTVPEFQGLHCKHLMKKFNTANALEKLKNLTVITLGIEHISKKLLHVLTRSMPQLAELHLESLWDINTICGLLFKEFLRPFVVHAPNIHTISVKNFCNPNLISRNDVAALSDIRKRTNNAKILTIYLHYNLIQAIQFTTTSDSYVQIKPLSQLKPGHLD